MKDLLRSNGVVPKGGRKDLCVQITGANLVNKIRKHPSIQNGVLPPKLPTQVLPPKLSSNLTPLEPVKLPSGEVFCKDCNPPKGNTIRGWYLETGEPINFLNENVFKVCKDGDCNFVAKDNTRRI